MRRKKDLNEERIISSDDIETYARNHSDFAFEMEILQLVQQTGSENTTWGGLYFDPNTGKQRQYDIRTELSLGKSAFSCCIKLAIECKNLKPHYPLVISCTPRNQSERCVDNWCFPQMPEAHYSEDEKGDIQWCPPIIEPHYMQIPKTSTSFYPLDEPVGRSLVQIGQDTDGKLTTDDAQTYDKWSQALASLHGVLTKLSSDNIPVKQKNLVFLPIVVVPDYTLWQINYSRAGEIIDTPKKVNAVSYWVDVTYDVRFSVGIESYNISHLHFFTKKGLLDFLTNEMHPKKAFS